jgi:transcriptional regulator NrdR family protein
MSGRVQERRICCPHCGTATRVGYSRRSADGHTTRRRRDCPRCGARYRTLEEIVATVRRPVAARQAAAAMADEARP